MRTHKKHLISHVSWNMILFLNDSRTGWFWRFFFFFFFLVHKGQLQVECMWKQLREKHKKHSTKISAQKNKNISQICIVLREHVVGNVYKLRNILVSETFFYSRSCHVICFRIISAYRFTIVWLERALRRLHNLWTFPNTEHKKQSKVICFLLRVRLKIDLAA